MDSAAGKIKEIDPKHGGSPIPPSKKHVDPSADSSPDSNFSSMLSVSREESEWDEDFEDFELESDQDAIDPDAQEDLRGDSDIVYEHALKHRAFFETAKKRRRRHLKNRMRGTIPALHFTGTRKTDFWRRYGVAPNKLVEQGNIQGVDTMLTEDEFKKLGPTERRIHINGQKFKIVSNRESTDSLHRALCQALGIAEVKYKDIKNIINAELTTNWQLFSRDVCNFGGKVLPMLNPSLCSPKVMIQRYRDMLDEGQSSVQEFELKAAALHFGFIYTIVEISSVNRPITVINCQDDIVLRNGCVKYFFLKSGQNLECYEFLVPIGPLKKIHDGLYPAVLRDVILIEQYRPWLAAELAYKENRYRPDVGPIPVGFAIDHRIFLHKSTISHDLWSLLAELMFRKLIHAPQIKNRIMDSKHNFALYYFACKAKKRYQVYGNASIEKLADDFSQRFSKESPRGDLEDLAQAAAYFDFSYTVIGVDAGGNFYWRDHVSQLDTRENAPYMAFFVKTTADKSMFWYALEDTGRSCPKEKKLYQDVQAGDLTAWEGKFYFHYKPKVHPSLEKVEAEPNPLLRVPTQVIFRASKWASKSFARLRSSVMASLSSAAMKSKSFVQSIFEFAKWMKRRRKVQPDKKVQALYVREQP